MKDLDPKDFAAWWSFDPSIDAATYVHRTIETYRNTPTTSGCIRPEDRQLARQLYDQRISLRTIYAAFLMAAVRRLTHAEDPSTIPPIRSLHYFLPLLDEIRAEPLDPGFFGYLSYKLDSLLR
jgi:hypothetical protein